MRTAVVTGGAGFIGSHLCERLVRDGYCVTCIDDLSSGLSENVAGLQRLKLVVRDVCEPLPAFRADEIYHLASPASPLDYQRRPLATLRTCVLGSINVLELARKTGARVLLASTSEVYGDPAVTPQSETYWGNVNPIGPRSCYDEGKRCAESLFVNYGDRVNVTIARLFNTYGPRMRSHDGRVIPTFVRQALAGEPLTVHGTGEQTRSFCYVTDMVDGLVRLMASGERGPVNLGGQDEISVARLAQFIAWEVGSTSVVVHHPQAVDDPQRRRPDLALAKELLGWAPQVGFLEGLRSTIQWSQTSMTRAADAS